MSWLHLASFNIRSSLSNSALYLALMLAPSAFVRVWLDRGLAIAGDGMRQEVSSGFPVDIIEVVFAPHGETIPAATPKASVHPQDIPEGGDK